MAVMKKVNYQKVKSNNDSNQLSEIFGETFGKSESKNSEVKMIPLRQIQLDPKGEFQKLFPINEEDYDKILESMKKKGFPKHQHILVAKILEEGISIPIDGHTRIKAAREAELEEIPVWEITVETRKEALLMAYAIQINRRNLSDGQKLIAIQAMDALKNPGRKTAEDESEKGKSAEKIADQLKMSTRQVEKGRAILKSGDEDTIEKVENGELSINAGYEKVKGKPSKAKNKAEKEDDLSDALSDNEGTPAGLNFSHTDGIERPDNKLSPEVDEERTLERKRAYETGHDEGFAEGFEKAMIFVLSEIKKGRTPEEVYNDERVADLSAEIISKFKLPEDAEDIVSKL